MWLKMRSPLISSFLSPFLVLVFSLTLNIPLSLSSYVNWQCRSLFTCGDITADYPFWGGFRPSNCGHPKLKLGCEDDQTPTILINDVKYNIRRIHHKPRILQISREDYRDDLCHPKFPNTTLPSALLQYSTNLEMITLHYGCPPLAKSVPGSFSCNNSYGYVQSGRHGPGVCNSSIVVPTNRDLISAGIPSSSIIRFGLSQGFDVTWSMLGMKSEDCDYARGRLGYSIELNKLVCLCSDGSFFHGTGTACPGYLDVSSTGSGFPIFQVLGIIVASTTLIVFCVQITRRRRSKSDKLQNDQKIEAFVKSYGSLCPQRYSYQDIKKMTKFFSNRLGQGGFGDVYKGQLRDGRLVAVKLLKESKGDGEDFINEVASISTTSHVNVVTFLGFCFEKKKRALVYKFMPNGSLDKYIYDHEFSTSTDRLGWNKMYLIALGIARGLEYLHRGCNTRIVHFDIKPHNILLDEDFCPKISDFGLSKQCIGKESIVSMLTGRGTPGYIAPEIFCRNFGHVSHKSDVYSYGMLIIEIAVGRKNMDARLSETSEIYFTDWIYRYTEPGNLFELQGVVTEEEKEIAKKMILVSLWCIQAFPSDRPPMSKVVEMLEGEADNLQIPPKPSLSSPARSIRCSSQTSGLPSSSTSELTILCPSE